MRTCVTSSYDVAGSGQSFLDAADRVIDSGQMDSHFDTLECYSFLWDIFKDDDTSPSSTTSGKSSEGGGDEEVISSSSSSRTVIRNKRSPSRSLSPPTTKEKATVDSPPDDVRAFFGHPLTRATNALNGEEVDTNADAEALLHEYKNLPSIERDDIKVSVRLSSFLDIVSGQQSDPSLSTTRPEIRSSLSSDAPVSPIAGQLNHDGDGRYEEEEDCEQKANDLAMTAYVNIFLQDELQLDECILNGPAIEQTDVNTEEAHLQITKQHVSKRSRAPKRGQPQPKRGQAGEVKRAKRKSRARPDAVMSTTNGQRRQIQDGRVLDEHGSSGFNESLEVGVHPVPGSQFRHEEAGVSTSTIVSSLLSGVGLPSTPTTDSNFIHSAEGQNRISSICAGLVPLSETSSTASNQQTSDHRDLSSQLNPIKVFTPAAATTNAGSISHAMPCSSASQLTADAPSLSTSPRVTVANTTPVSVDANDLSASGNSHHVSQETAVKENGYLKRVLSEKIRSRQSIEDNLVSMPTQALKFITENDADIRMEPTCVPAVSIKQEDSYADCYAHQYTYGSELANNIPSLTNCSALAMTSANGFPNILPVAMEMCEEAITPHDCNNNNGLAGMAANSLHHIPNNTTDHVSFHQHRQHHHQSHQQQQHCHGNHAIDHVTGNSMKIQPSQEDYFQALQPLQPLQPTEPHTHMPSTSCNSANMNNAAACFYNHHGYHNNPNSQLLDANKQMAVERYLHQQYAYSSGYTHFLNPDRSYNMKSPDSGFHEPCLSPTSTPLALQETPTSGSVDVKTEKPKKKKSSNGGGALMRQYSSSSSEKTTSRSTVVQKLEVNSTGYRYFLETPISTTQRRHEDRVTYLNKSQYYGLSLECNIQERIIKCAIVKSVIILAFREEKPMEDERRAWEFWHGRQHSYKQRILDIDTKNCQGVLPQNIEELAFNAVAVKWNPMEGPVRVNIAVHCLSTDFSNQKGVKGIPLHIQIDTYEQSLQETQLVHRGYCQIKAFCDKGAERKTRDEERRKAAKGKPEEFNNIPVSTKTPTLACTGRRRLEEAFHEPCERSEFYSMANTTSPPVFFNPLHENSEFIHKSLTLGVVPSQEEEVTSVPNKLELPDSCDDFYINSPVKRPRTDSGSNLKDQQKVLLYIRESHETAYTALMLEIPTLHGLLRSIELKYSIAPSKVKHVYKKSRKGILVKLDDNIVRHYSHEATFIIETNILNDNGDYEIILVEIDPVSS